MPFTYQETFDTVADLGGLTNETFAGNTKNARIIRRGIFLAMRQIQALCKSSLTYGKDTTITGVDGQEIYPLPSDFTSIDYVSASIGSLKLPLDKMSKSEYDSSKIVPRKSAYTKGYHVYTDNHVDKIAFYPTPTSTAVTFNVRYQTTYGTLNYGAGSTDGSVPLNLEEGFEMLPVYWTLANFSRALENIASGTDWGNEFEKLLQKYTENGMINSENPVVRRTRPGRRGNISLISITPP